MGGDGEIREFLEGGAWEARFDEECLRQGMRLRARVQVQWMEAETGEDGSVEFKATVDGEQCTVTCWPGGGLLDQRRTSVQLDA